MDRLGNLEAEVIPPAGSPLDSAWRELAEESGNAFVAPEWYRAWVDHYGECEPLVVGVREAEGKLRGLMPMVAIGRGRRTVVRFAGWNVGDRFHPVARQSDWERVAAVALRALTGRAPGGLTIVLDNAASEGHWWQEAASSSSIPLSVTTSRASEQPYVTLAGTTWGGYLAARSRNFRSQVRRRRRRLERQFEVTFRRTRDRAELDADISLFFRLHDERWGRRGRSSLDDERKRAFHRDFAAAALERGWLRLWFLDLGGEPAAAWYGWRVGSRYSYYSAGFAQRWFELGVGGVLLARTIEAAIEEGAAEYDLLLGDEPYKLRYATGKRRVETVVLARRMSSVAMRATVDAAAWRVGTRLPPGARRRVAAVYRALTRTPLGSR